MSRRALVASVLIASLAGCRGSGGAPATTAPAPAVAPAPSAAPPAPAPIARATKVWTVEGITEYRLDNGLQVLLFPDVTQSTVTVNITYLVGSRHEGYGETGMAHLLEHMLFKGTAKYRNVLKLLEERGAHLNGTTWTDRTNYYETLTASQDNLDFALALEADRMINALISPDDLKTEFSVVRNEFEIGENYPQHILTERIESTAYLWHNYGKSTIGSRADIERVPVPALRAFYEKYYQPDNAVLVVSGKFDTPATLASIESTFGRIPRPARTLAPPYTVEPVQDGERSVTLRRNGEVAAFGVAYHTVGAASPDHPAVEAALDVLTREPSGRLYKKLVETKLATAVDGGVASFRDPTLASISVTVRDVKNLDKVEQITIAEIEKLAAGPIDDKEVARWRAASLKDIELAMTNSQRIAILLSEMAAIGDWRMLFASRDRIAKVTAADVRRVAAAFFKQSNRTTGRFIPTKSIDRAPHVETPDVAAAIKDVKDSAVADQGEVFTATLEHIDARTTRKQLAGGIEAALLPKKTRGGKVLLQLGLRWGDERTVQGKQTIAEVAARVMARGTATKSYQELQDLKDQLKARIWVGGGATGYTLHIETLRDHLPAALELGAEILTRPSFPAKELELVRQELLAELEEQQVDPQAVAITTFGQLTSKWPKSDPRYARSAAEEIAEVKAVKLADLRAFHRDFVGAGRGELVVIGDFDPDAITAQVERLIGATRSRRPYTRLADRPFGVPGQSRSIEVKDKEMTMLIGGHDLAMSDTDPDYPAWVLVGQVLGGDLGSRLWMRLREKEGLSYGVGAWTNAEAKDESGSVGFYAMVAPQNLAKAKASILEEVRRMATGDVTAEELQRAKDAWVKSQDTALSNDGHVAGVLRGQLYEGRTMAFTLAARAKVLAVTPAELARVAKQRLQPDRLVIVDAGDPSKAEPAKK